MTTPHTRSQSKQAKAKTLLKKAIHYYDHEYGSVKGEVFEQLLFEAATEAGLNVKDFTPGSHSPGADMTIQDEGLSLKTSIVTTTTDTVKISSYRLTSLFNDAFKPLDMLAQSALIVNRIDKDRNNFDYYMLLVRVTKRKATECYDVYKIPTGFLKAGKLEWTPKCTRSKKQNWAASSRDEPYTMTITESMSSQLWIQVKLSAIKEFLFVTIPIKTVPKVQKWSIHHRYKLMFGGGDDDEATEEPDGTDSDSVSIYQPSESDQSCSE
jgi:hypothetical protein